MPLSGRTTTVVPRAGRAGLEAGGAAVSAADAGASVGGVAGGAASDAGSSAGTSTGGGAAVRKVRSGPSVTPAAFTATRR